ncbi:hypothetical protein [Paenibacillus nuruki]|uniref:hypothetical protein n=1 Tax=Paenibacillus nuruki TaxID=1886670 RepID=UPI0028041842|nr:hypothetical protein [Paenibacillus nuruki]CAJ1315892.1 Phage portal protein [Paenibacillus nuruki]
MSEENIQENIPIQDDSYLSILTSTVVENYPKYAQERILKTLEKNEVVKLKTNRPNPKQVNFLDLSSLEDSERQLIVGIEQDNRVVKRIEKEEFLKSYKFSALFAVKSIENKDIEELQKKGKITDFFAGDDVHDVLIRNHRYQEAVPTKYAIGNVLMFKFSILLSGTKPNSNERKEVKFPVLGVYFNHLGALEIRMDRAKTYFQEDEFFYKNQIDFVINWFETNLNCEVENISLPPLIEYIKQNAEGEVNIHSQAMNLATGGKVVLDTGINEDYILPLLGELKELIKANQELFDYSPEIKKLLDGFISETETNADLPWIALIWKGKDNANTTVKFKHNYLNQGYSFWQYYGQQSDMEKMDYVTEYIVKNQREFERLQSNGAGETRETIGDTIDN